MRVQPRAFLSASKPGDVGCYISSVAAETPNKRRESTFAKMAYGDITRYGSKFGYGQFYAQAHVERIDGSRLKAMFLPRLTAEANALLQRHYRASFVQGQLQHYGVGYDEKDLSGNGTLVLKKMLQAGKVRHLTLPNTLSVFADMHHSAIRFPTTLRNYGLKCTQSG
jgi:hypothetical protein